MVQKNLLVLSTAQEHTESLNALQVPVEDIFLTDKYLINLEITHERSSPLLHENSSFKHFSLTITKKKKKIILQAINMKSEALVEKSDIALYFVRLSQKVKICQANNRSNSKAVPLYLNSCRQGTVLKALRKL